MIPKHRDDRNPSLRSILQEGDPAADGREPTAGETAHLRARVIDVAREAAREAAPTPVPDRRWRPAAVAAALLLVAALGVVLHGVRRSVAPTPAPREAGAGGAHDPADAPRQIQFTTPGGTRVVWMLYPDDTESDSRAARRPGGRS